MLSELIKENVICERKYVMLLRYQVHLFNLIFKRRIFNNDHVFFLFNNIIFKSHKFKIFNCFIKIILSSYFDINLEIFRFIRILSLKFINFSLSYKSFELSILL